MSDPSPPERADRRLAWNRKSARSASTSGEPHSGWSVRSRGGQLEFALKYEGVDLAALRELFKEVSPADVDPKLNYAATTGAMSSRHRVRNNLPGPRTSCPLVRRTPKLQAFAEQRLK